MNENLGTLRSGLYGKNINQKFYGAILDVDGTLTVRGQKHIPAALCTYLADLSITIPMALCTGRDFKACLSYLDMIFEYARDVSVCRENWYICCENGSQGYLFDPKKGDYSQWYNVEYPYGPGHYQELFETLQSIIGPESEGGVLRGTSMIFRARNYTDLDQTEVAKRSQLLYQRALPIIQKYDPDQILTVADTAIAVIIFPKEGHKGRGTFEFGKILRTQRNISLSENLAELLAVGDRPNPGGNDETFLDGMYGTPFTTGDLHPEHILPLPIYDPQTGSILYGPDATLSLLQQVRFRII